MSRNESAEVAASELFSPPPGPKKKSSAADAEEEEAEEVGLDLPWLAARSLDAATSGPRSRLAARRASHSRRGDEEEAEADADADAEAALLLL